MKATKATNIQIRLLVEESQQLNSKKWDTRKTQILRKWNDTDFKLYAKTKQRINCHELKEKSKNKPPIFFLLFITRIAL